MSGHFLLANVSPSEFAAASAYGKVSPIFHADVSLTVRSVTHLTRILNGGTIKNRNELPRHIYLSFYDSFDPPEPPQWLDALRRPECVGFGLKSLCGAAEAAWRAGDRLGAVAAQAEQGRAIIEIYFIGGLRP